MATIVMLGGNGYIGRHTTLKWLEKNSTAQFYVLSRSGKNSLVDPRVHTLKDVDVPLPLLNKPMTGFAGQMAKTLYRTILKAGKKELENEDK